MITAVPSGTPLDTEIFSSACIAEGCFVFVSGQGPLVDGRYEPAAVDAEARLAIENLRRVLEASGRRSTRWFAAMCTFGTLRTTMRSTACGRTCSRRPARPHDDPSGSTPLRHQGRGRLRRVASARAAQPAAGRDRRAKATYGLRSQTRPAGAPNEPLGSARRRRSGGPCRDRLLGFDRSLRARAQTPRRRRLDSVSDRRAPDTAVHPRGARRSPRRRRWACVRRLHLWLRPGRPRPWAP